MLIWKNVLQHFWIVVSIIRHCVDCGISLFVISLPKYCEVGWECVYVPLYKVAGCARCVGSAEEVLILLYRRIQPYSEGTKTQEGMLALLKTY